MVQLLLAVILVALMACHDAYGTSCRFASSSSSQGSCIFPCRCTDGCNVTTGECLSDGQCIAGVPGAYKWEGLACQKGNVAYNKKAEQSSDNKLSTKYPARRAVDGNVDSSMDNNHCAYAKTTSGENAWWAVDLGEIHKIFSVIIYNRGDCCHQRLEAFVLSVGEDRDRRTHTLCGTHTGSVSSGGTVRTKCEAIGRYVSFRRNGGYEANIANLCEVVVIGYRYINCDLCPVPSACNNVTGCEVCSSGKQQPDCVKDCDSGKYGVNCDEECGQCKDSSRCEATSGRCINGCQMWYTSDECKTFIPVPVFLPHQQPELAKITSSAAAVRWRAAGNIPPGLEKEYYYLVWLEADGEAERNVARVGHRTDTDWFEARITGLTFNTQYSVSVKPYRHHKEEHQGGTRTVIATFKTSCIVPVRPVIMTIQTPSAQDSACAYITVEWQMLNEAGCDNLTSISVWYKRQSLDKWTRKEIRQINQTKVTINYLMYVRYEVKIAATNNENLTSASEIVIANLQNYHGFGVCLLSGPVIGLVAAVFVFGVFCGVIALMAVQRWRTPKLRNLNKRPLPNKRKIPKIRKLPPPKVEFSLANQAGAAVGVHLWFAKLQ